MKIARIAIMTNCRLGDALNMMPALRVIRQNYPHASLTIISEAAGPGLVAARDILDDCGLVDDFIEMKNPPGLLSRLWERIKFIIALRQQDFDLAIILFPPYPPLTMKMVNRFQQYLSFGGAKQILKPDKIIPFTPSPAGGMEPLPQVSDAMLDFLHQQGIAGSADFKFDFHDVVQPVKGQLAIAPGSNMTAKTWPKEHFVQALQQIKREYPNLTPVYIGGENERELCQWLYEQMPGKLIVGQPLKNVIQVIRGCQAYFGNDTGIMHLAAACGLKCTAIFSARCPRGEWYPKGDGHQILQACHLPCEGCLLNECPKTNPCIEAITVDQAADAVLATLISL